jgi:ribonuclease P protein component
MIGRLLRKCDFERTLAVPPHSRSAHFAVHYVPARPSPTPKSMQKLDRARLCTERPPVCTGSVDNHVLGWWLGSVIPKRHARRAVTRNMLRRQVRAAMERHESDLRPGLWLVRLRQPFSPQQYRSADSGVLRAAAACELDRLLARAGG